MSGRGYRTVSKLWTSVVRCSHLAARSETSPRLARRSLCDGFACQGLIDQLSSAYGDQFTLDEATAGATQAELC